MKIIKIMLIGASVLTTMSILSSAYVNKTSKCVALRQKYEEGKKEGCFLKASSAPAPVKRKSQLDD